MPSIDKGKAAARSRAHYSKVMSDPARAEKERARWRRSDAGKRQRRHLDPTVRETSQARHRRAEERHGEEQRLHPAGATEAQRRRIIHRARQLQRDYGMTLDDYDALLVSQEGACAICRRAQDGKPLHVDHDHATNSVRGLLCGSCNRAIGLLGDDADRIRSAAEYLEGSQ